MDRETAVIALLVVFVTLVWAIMTAAMLSWMLL